MKYNLTCTVPTPFGLLPISILESDITFIGTTYESLFIGAKEHTLLLNIHGSSVLEITNMIKTLETFKVLTSLRG